MMEHWDKLSLMQIVLKEEESHLEQGKWDPYITPKKDKALCMSILNMKIGNIKIQAIIGEFVYSVTLKYMYI
jgi:hypothetical protein